MKPKGSYYFVGIGGSGMNPLAQILHQQGSWVGGSDRNFDRKVNTPLFSRLQKQGIILFAQDGKGITKELNAVVVSSAIEQDNIELKRARFLNIPILHRADLLAEIVNHAYGIAIAGTSGKTSLTGMIASIVDAAGKDPTVINGGIIKQYEKKWVIGNAQSGSSNIVIVETDESDGSIIKFYPKIGILTNIAKDHKEIEDLKSLFFKFAQNTSEYLIINADCPLFQGLKAKHTLTYSIQNSSNFRAKDIKFSKHGCTFRVRKNRYSINVPGLHNLYNALGAVAVGASLGLSFSVIRDGLARFRGIKRRLEIIEEKDGITVVDDFAHNPDKITASIKTLREFGKRLIIIFQPHGYGPTKFLFKEIVDTFNQNLQPYDFLFLLDIYDAGGTAERSITSQDVVKMIRGPQAFYIQQRKEIIEQLKKIVCPGDVVAVMGARDDTLSVFVRKIAKSIS